MATIKWATPAAIGTAINGDATAPTLKALASAGQKLGSEYDNETNLYRWGVFELYCRGASAFTAGGTADLYLIQSTDGTNYGDGDDSVAPPLTRWVHSFPLRAVSTQQRINSTPILLPPFKFKPLIVNKGGQAFTNTDNENVLKYRLFNEQVA